MAARGVRDAEVNGSSPFTPTNSSAGFRQRRIFDNSPPASASRRRCGQASTPTNFASTPQFATIRGMEVKDAIKFIIIRSVGNFLLLFAIFGVVATFGPALYYEVQFQIIKARGVTFRVAENSLSSNSIKLENARQKPSFSDLLTGSKEQLIMPPDTEFSIVIPKLGASARVIANVDPSNEENFLPALFRGVAHAQGSVFPGLSGNIYLFAHSADNFWDVGQYNAIFYLLKDLENGDEIVVFYQNKRYDYFVTDSRIVEPEEVHFITEANTGNEQLILQTCWPPGTAWKRLLVFARPRKTDTIFREN